MNKRTYRIAQALLLLLTLMVVFASFYAQYFVRLQPCPLCIMQRICAVLLGMLCLMGLGLSTLKRVRLVIVLQCFFALFGLFFASRQLWLQSLPPERIPACLPGLDVLYQYFPWQDVVRALFWGQGNCAEINWQWYGLSMPAWSALYFLVMLTMSIGLLLVFRRRFNKLRS